MSTEKKEPTLAHDQAFATAETDTHWGNLGLTKREYFAALTLQGFCACPQIQGTSKLIAAAAVKFADDLIEALNK